MNYWLLIFFSNWLINVITIEFFAIRKLKNIIKIDEKRDSKYYAFSRSDTFWMSRLWLYPTCHFAISKILFGFSSIFFCAVALNMCKIGLKPREKIVGIRYTIMRIICYITSNIVIFCAGSCVWIFNYKPEDVSYKKYLGEDWKLDWDQ